METPCNKSISAQRAYSNQEGVCEVGEGRGGEREIDQHG